MAIKIPVSAELNQQDLTAQIKQMESALNGLGRVAQDAGRVKFTPVSNGTLDELKRIRAEFEAIQRLAPGLRKALEAGGQGGRSFEQVDWGKVWSDPNQRASHAWAMLKRLRPGSIEVPGPVPTPGGPSTPSGSDWRPPRQHGKPTRAPAAEASDDDDDENSTPGTRKRSMWRRAAGSAVAGMAGGAASQIGGMGGAIASGALSGGLMGGPLGAVIGGMTGAVSGLLGAMAGARDVAISLDTLKRSLGDTGVAFEGLQATTRNLSDTYGLTDAESTKLTSQYARAANSDKSLPGLHDEVGVGLGFSRSFGLDPATGVDFFGQMRGMGITQNADDSKRLALLIGEAVAKAGDLPRMADVMAGLSGYLHDTAAHSLSSGNANAWLGKFAALESSGITGITPGTSTAMIGRANAAVAQGGLTEAGRNFMSGVLQRDQGLNVIQAQAQLEGGLFATGRSTFGEGSAMGALYKSQGIAPPSAATSDRTNAEMLFGTMERAYAGRPDMLVNAISTQFGLSHAQAAAWEATGSTKIGALGARLNRMGVDFSQVNATGISKISQIEADKTLTDTQKDVAIRDAATQNQEKTLGSEARDNAIKTANATERLATEGLPMLNTIQAGILKMAGVDTPGQLLKQIEHAKRKEGIEQDLGAKKDAALKERNDKISFLHRGMPGLQTPEEAAVDKKYWDAKQAYDDAMGGEESRYKDELTAKDVTPATAAPGAAPAAGQNTPGTSSGLPASVTSLTPEIRKRAAQSDALHGLPEGTTAGLIMQESSGNSAATSNKGARGLFQIMPDNVAEFSRRRGRQLDPTNTEDAFLMYDGLMAERDRKYGGDTEKKLRSYHGGYDESKWGDVNADYVPAIERRKRELAAMEREQQKLSFSVQTSGEFILRDTNGQKLAVADVQTSVGAPTPSGVR